MVATGDKAAGADIIRSMAQRAGADITEVEGSHVIMISQPQAVTDVILKAALARASDGSSAEASTMMTAHEQSLVRRAETGRRRRAERRLRRGRTDDGPPVILLHGWPYDIHSYAEVAPLLAAAGYRVIVPYLRGYGTTRFLSERQLRNGQQAALGGRRHRAHGRARDRRRRSSPASTGARGRPTSSPRSGPERCTAMVSVSGYLIGSQAANERPLPPAAELAWWYQFYFATERGRAGYDTYRRDFARLIWQLRLARSGTSTTRRSSAARPSFDNPDHVDIVIHNYRWRLGLAAGRAAVRRARGAARRGPVITVPTITLEGDANGAPHPDPGAYAGEVRRPVRAPDHHRRRRAQPAAGGARAFADAIVDVAGLAS